MNEMNGRINQIGRDVNRVGAGAAAWHPSIHWITILMTKVPSLSVSVPTRANTLPLSAPSIVQTKTRW